jgi:hypothetical protein
MIGFKYDDGGRANAGFKGIAKDCATRAIAIASGKGYREVYDHINKVAGKPVARSGVTKDVVAQVMQDLGFKWTATMKIGSGCKVHLKADELPTGRVVCRTSRHLVAVIDGVVHDTYDCTRDGSRCVYGYWTM